MATSENPKVGGSFILVISFLLFVFTVSGAILLLLYVIQPESPATSGYAVIGVFLVFLPWLFWLLTFLYRVISRSCGFRMMCCCPFGSGYPANVEKDIPAARPNLVSNNVAPATSSDLVSTNVVSDVVANDGIVGDGDREETSSPRRVHFGGVMVIGNNNDGNANNNLGSPKADVFPRSLSFASLSSRHSKESETPLRSSMD